MGRRDRAELYRHNTLPIPGSYARWERDGVKRRRNTTRGYNHFRESVPRFKHSRAEKGVKGQPFRVVHGSNQNHRGNEVSNKW